ncbi:MAG: sulfite exporter TauE/SafE family protein [Corynebacterium sp.]|nr:sulfite exporter TauE/SafE family protein [Corynebacterium sp.]
MKPVYLYTAIAGAIAQLIDGTLGMGFGVTSTTVLLSLAALSPAVASAVVHTAELGTTLVSGASHTRFGNVNWKAAALLGVPGAISAFIGALLLSHISTNAAKPFTATILVGIGIYLLVRFSFGRVQHHFSGRLRPKTLVGIGLFGGFIDATGGGGWGPITSSSLMALGDHEPRKVVGTVNTAEFLVTLAATIGFVIGLWHDLAAHFLLVIALLIGGAITAPIAAWCVAHFNSRSLGGLVGTILITLNISKVLSLINVPTEAIHSIQWSVAIIGVLLSLRAYARARKALAPEPVLTSA